MCAAGQGNYFLVAVGTAALTEKLVPNLWQNEDSESGYRAVSSSNVTQDSWKDGRFVSMWQPLKTTFWFWSPNKFSDKLLECLFRSICKNNIIGMESALQHSFVLFCSNFLTLISCFLIWFQLDQFVRKIFPIRHKFCVGENSL